MSGLFRFLPLLLLFLQACDRRQIESPKPFDTGQWSYFPLYLGHSAVYQVDSLIFDPAPGGGIAQLASTTLVKEEMTDTIRDNTGQLVYLVERYERPNSNEPWQLKRVDAAARNGGQAIWIEQNLRFLKMLFPMDQRSDWDGNIWIDESREFEIAGERMRPFSNWNYAVDSINIPARVGAFQFDSTLVITEANDENLIEKRYSRARYARNVGLVEKEQYILDTQYCNQLQIPPDCETRPWELKAERGYILKQTILEYH